MQLNMDTEQDSLFRRYQGALLYTGNPHEKVEVDPSLLRRQIMQTKSLFARYYTDSQLITPPYERTCESKSEKSIDDTYLWWHCVKDDPIYLEQLNTKQRYRINKGIRLNEIELVDTQTIKDCIDELYDLLVDSFSDYPEAYRPKSDLRPYAESFIATSAESDNDVWFVRDRESRKLVGMSYCRLHNNVVELKVVKVRPSYLKNEVNAALGYAICRHYLNDLQMKYINDGERNIRHQTNYQDFLERVLNFKKAYCKLHVVYHPLLKPIIKILYPFRKIIGKLGQNNPLIYNVFSVLMQEEIVRKSNFP